MVMSQLETDPMFCLKLSRTMARRFLAGNEVNDSNCAGICETVNNDNHFQASLVIMKRDFQQSIVLSLQLCT